MVHTELNASGGTHSKLGAGRNLRFYDQIAPIYDRLYDDVDADEAVRQWCLLVKSCVHLRKHDQATLPRLLDIGCGTGMYLEPWAAAGFCVTGVDGSSAMISRARRRRKVSALSSRIRLVCGDLRKRCPPLEKAGPFDVAVAHFNFLNLFPPGVLWKVLKLLVPCMTADAKLFTDCASPTAMPVEAHERVALEGGEVVEIVTRPNPADSTVARSYQFRALRTSERYWLHSTPQLKAAAAQAGWQLERAYAWTPDHPKDPWHPIGKRWTGHRLCIFRLISASAAPSP